MYSIELSYNDPHFLPDLEEGYYESWFVRANHPERPLALWIRYTVFSRRGHAGDAIGELWAIYFDGEKAVHAVGKSEVPLSACSFDTDPLHVAIGKATLGETELHGEAGDSPGSNRLRWDLQMRGEHPPVFLFPEPMYESPLPKAKSVVANPGILVSGSFWIDGAEVVVDGWRGSQNHNWGEKHTDRYAWGQVVGFDEEPEAFLEMATARIKVGPLWVPAMTPVVLRLKGREYRLNDPLKCFRRARYSCFDWHFRAASPELTIEGRIHASREDFVCLRYANPPGGWKYCLNSKIASAEITVTLPGNSPPIGLHARCSAGFEILTDDASHGLTPRV